jgi:hypothetical protein
MTQEALAPPIEQLRKGNYEAPQRDQNVNRVAYRRRSPLDTLWDRGEISYPMHQSAQKLYYHYRGSQGVRVQTGDDCGLSADTEYPRTYHAQKIAQAEHSVLPSEWSALMHMVDETKTLELIGRSFAAVSKREIARRTGLMLVSTGLDRLSLLWGFQQRQRIP